MNVNISKQDAAAIGLADAKDGERYELCGPITANDDGSFTVDVDKSEPEEADEEEESETPPPKKPMMKGKMKPAIAALMVGDDEEKE